MPAAITTSEPKLQTNARVMDQRAPRAREGCDDGFERSADRWIIMNEDASPQLRRQVKCSNREINYPNTSGRSSVSLRQASRFGQALAA